MKLDTILNQVNAPENSRQQIGNTHSGLQHLANIITERLNNTQINESDSYLNKETKEECQKSVKKKQQKIKQTNH